jgi:hypothetical protein
MSLERRPEGIIFVKVILGYITDFGKYCVKSLGGMGLGKYNFVSFRPITIIRINLEVMKIESSYNFHQRHRPSAMPQIA